MNSILYASIYGNGGKNELCFVRDADGRGSYCNSRAADGEYWMRRCLTVAEALLFLLGFTSVTTVYEIAKTGKKTKSDKVNRAVDTWKRKSKKVNL